jgi:hypothetical protein
VPTPAAQAPAPPTAAPTPAPPTAAPTPAPPTAAPTPAPPTAAPTPALEPGPVILTPQIPVAPSWASTPLAGAISANQLDVTKITPQMITALEPQQTRDLMDLLHQSQVFQSQRLENGVMTPPSPASPAAYVVGQIEKSGDVQALSKLYTGAPDRVLRHLSTTGTSALTSSEGLAAVWNNVKSDGQLDGPEARALGNLFEAHLQRTSFDNPDKAIDTMSQLMLSLESSDIPFNAVNAGEMTGAMMAGLTKYLNGVTASDEERIARMGSILDGLGSVTGFMKGSWGAIADVALYAIQEMHKAHDNPRQFGPFVNQLMGDVRNGWEYRGRDLGWSDSDISKAKERLEDVMLMNGLGA